MLLAVITACLEVKRRVSDFEKSIEFFIIEKRMRGRDIVPSLGVGERR
jgi:hypothetical protein